MPPPPARIPPLLRPHLGLPPPGSLTLVTSVLGASANWLVGRWVGRLLAGEDAGGVDGQGEEEEEEGTTTTTTTKSTTRVVLCSFLREGGFWRGRMLALPPSTAGRLLLVDGLTALCVPEGDSDGASRPSGRQPGDHVLRGVAVEDVRRGLGAAVRQALAGAEREAGADAAKVVLVLDQMDVWLAMGEGAVGVGGVMGVLGGLREHVHATILTVSADDPLLHARNTTLEKNHAGFVLSLAHEAHRVVSLRLLDTGTASDVSGVVRITAGGKSDEGGGGIPGGVEFLYHVEGDGGVRVFERGA